MKAWFVFLINGKKIGTWAQGISEARIHLIEEYGDVPMEYIGNTCHNRKIEPDKVIYTHMSAFDRAIAFGLA